MEGLLKKRVRLLAVLLLSLTMLLCSVGIVNAAERLMPAGVDDLEALLKDRTELVTTDNGYMRVCYDGKKIIAEQYDKEFNILTQKTIAMELPLWGGFYKASDGYYVVEGQNNTAENDSAEVIRVIKYDSSWNRKGAANITSNPDLFGGEVRYPFDMGCVEFAEYNGVLYFVTGHEGYVDASVGQGHQGYLLIAVDMDNMTGTIVDSDLWHSFAQYIENDGSDLYVLQLSEGSRYTSLARLDAGEFQPDEYSSYPGYESIPVLKYGGNRTSAWAVECYASVDGLALSADNVLGIGTSIDQSLYDSANSDTAHNIYLTVTPKNNLTEEATSVKWLTDFSGDGMSFLTLKLTKVNDNRFMISWEEQYDSEEADAKECDPDDTLSGNTMHYLFVDGAGNVVSEEFTAAAAMSDCSPIVSGSKIVYSASTSNMVNFYTIDANTGEFSKKCYRVAGDSAEWNLNDGVLTISGSGDLIIDQEANYRIPISSTQGGFSYSSSDNAWKPIRSRVNKIVIEEGITSIPESAFIYYSNLTEVELKDGVKSIGNEAFYSCRSLEKVLIPDSVTEIGEDILWTGSTWVGSGEKVYRGKIHAKELSYAIQYAKENGVGYEITEHIWGDELILDKESTCIEKGTKSIHCKYCDATKDPVELELGDHTWSDWEEWCSPTCMDPGEEYRYCTECYEEEYREIPADGIHVWSDWSLWYEATEWYDGQEVKYCYGCYKEKSRDILRIGKTKLSASTMAYNGKARKPGVTVTDRKGNKLVEGEDYTVTIKNSAGKKVTKPVNVGTYKVVVTFKGNYSGEVTKSYKINPKSTAITKVTPGKKKFTVNWTKRTSQVTGYQIKYSTSQKFTASKTSTVKSYKTTKQTIQKLKPGKKYYIKIRTYKTVNGTKYYSAWSKVSTVKVKK